MLAPYIGHVWTKLGLIFYYLHYIVTSTCRKGLKCSLNEYLGSRKYFSLMFNYLDHMLAIFGPYEGHYFTISTLYLLPLVRNVVIFIKWISRVNKIFDYDFHKIVKKVGLMKFDEDCCDDFLKNCHFSEMFYFLFLCVSCDLWTYFYIPAYCFRVIDFITSCFVSHVLKSFHPYQKNLPIEQSFWQIFTIFCVT